MASRGPGYLGGRLPSSGNRGGAVRHHHHARRQCSSWQTHNHLACRRKTGESILCVRCLVSLEHHFPCKQRETLPRITAEEAWRKPATWAEWSSKLTLLACYHFVCFLFSASSNHQLWHGRKNIQILWWWSTLSIRIWPVLHNVQVLGDEIIHLQRGSWAKRRILCDIGEHRRNRCRRSKYGHRHATSWFLLVEDSILVVEKMWETLRVK